MRKLLIESQRASDIIDAGVIDDPEYTLVSNEYIGQWRWGVTSEAVIKDLEGNLWGVVYKTQTGDNYYSSLEDGKTVTFYPYKAVEVTTIQYKKIKD